QALQRPVAAPFHAGGHAGEGDEGAEGPARPLEAERREVVLDAVVVTGQCRRAPEAYRAVGADEPAARPGGRGHRRGPDRSDGGNEQSTHGHLLDPTLRRMPTPDEVQRLA